ncbi:hypothetical protein [Actinoplanes auranticolor]|uniref:Uncharacterized protein n=1 Tax=Actinoplanes auranticolor TaxID=47988 RepID=A0A919VNS1_9ACTN|nr:hypothetical protein [Actinoplanes auranticolor]GIM62918.1 hypothetical protein Aau02nite_00680 [Actinoplanes auranticolor]
MTSEDRVVTNAAGTDQHITGSPETGDFITDQAPTATTPAHGSSNSGVNATGANKPGAAEDATGESRE